jgi:phage terminase large subunit
MGTNPSLCIFSEFAMQDPMAWSYLRPILAANDGIALFISTPRGFNHMFQMYEMAQRDPYWYTMFMTVNDTQHMSLQALEQEKKEMPEDLFQQEYYCSFSLGIEGSIYSKIINNMRLKGQITDVPWESGFKVHTAWDIGRDTTAIIFFQTIGQSVRIIDYMEKANENLEYFASRVLNKEYIYGKHFFPHDMRVTEWGGPKFTRIEKARQLGIKATVVDDVALEDGLEYVQSNLSKIWIDQKNAAQLIKCLENYRYEYDAKKQIYKRTPLHNWASHGADAMRYLCLSLPKTHIGTSPEELEKRYREAYFGDDKSHLPSVFRDEVKGY